MTRTMSTTKGCLVTGLFGIFLETNKHHNLTRPSHSATDKHQSQMRLRRHPMVSLAGVQWYYMSLNRTFRKVLRHEASILRRAILHTSASVWVWPSNFHGMSTKTSSDHKHFNITWRNMLPMSKLQ